MNHYYSYICSVFFFVASGCAQSENIEARFLFVGDKTDSAYLGAEQGLKEANLQGEFLGQTYTLESVELDQLNTEQILSATAIVSALDSEALQQLAADYPQIAILNASNDDDALRACTQNLLHVIPSAKMKADAIAQWQQKTPDSKAVAQAWHPKFVKFAARDLNKRFKKTHGVEMDDHAWAGWGSVKMVADAVARKSITDPDKMLNFLKTELGFDGQKGIRMDFRETGQLRQPILIVEGDTIHAEAPIRGVANPPTVDSLGKTHCDATSQ